MVSFYTKSTPLLFLFCMAFFSLDAQITKVSQNGRYLTNDEGEAKLYLGDTAWELFHRLSLEAADTYLKNRAEKGFTVIQAVVLAQLGGLTAANANGDLPLKDSDPAQPIEAYFRHVDAIVDRANELGLTIAMLPTWGNYWSETNGKDLIFTPESAYTFGQFLGKRYTEKQIIWVLGGDENINTPKERAIIENMVKGLQSGDTEGQHLMTFHPRGPGRSSDYFHTAEWLDFNMYQSSHAAHDHDNGLYAEYDYQLKPVKPTLDGEPRYELIPAGFYFSGANRLDLFDDYDSRQAAYWSILAGAAGHTYGNNSIWQMWSPGHDAVLGAKIPWNVAIDHPGAFQMKYLKQLFSARSFHQLIPNQQMILSGPSSIGAKVRAAVAADASYAIIYSPRGEVFTIDQSVIKAKQLRSIWYDPRYGISHPILKGNTFGIQSYTPPTNGRGNDWILIIEDAALGLPLPGLN